MSTWQCWWHQSDRNDVDDGNATVMTSKQWWRRWQQSTSDDAKATTMTLTALKQKKDVDNVEATMTTSKTSKGRCRLWSDDDNIKEMTTTLMISMPPRLWWWNDDNFVIVLSLLSSSLRHCWCHPHHFKVVNIIIIALTSSLLQCRFDVGDVITIVSLSLTSLSTLSLSFRCCRCCCIDIFIVTLKLLMSSSKPSKHLSKCQVPQWTLDLHTSSGCWK